ncbi:MAG: DEAD/DEAH box helicase [Nevskiaceae bacterium]|nr:MAG: DEAD/DEAH box helicase [Nevskiaceae bacterium]TBR72007.1 MAG: DEAD/DEAH box helicase [Nevskiaceae bacterium]
MAAESTDPSAAEVTHFADLALAEPLLRTLAAIGYEAPSPIQARTIPLLLAGRDVLGQAQTGTGKTAAFALPILSRLDLSLRFPQALVLAPTRELAIQVAEAFQTYAANLPGFQVLPIYGGQSYQPQLRGLQRGAHVVVGTPGRVVDHIKRGTLQLNHLRHLVLDEADEMLQMGFIDDVEWVLAQTPPGRQVALFSATLPAAIRRVAQTHLTDPAEVTIRNKTATAPNIRQRYWLASGLQKLDALTRFLETEDFDGMLVFARTKAATQELADKLAARGYAAAALNGDMEQRARERTVARLKDRQIDILVATDVAARGLDVERISHVVNFDIPTDVESYVHRIGRTGRAGRSGEAILFVTPRERYLLRAIERATRQPVEAVVLPTLEAVGARRFERFTETLSATLTSAESDAAVRTQLEAYRAALADFEARSGTPLADIAAAIALQMNAEKPLFPAQPAPTRGSVPEPRAARAPAAPRRERPGRKLPPVPNTAPATVPDAALGAGDAAPINAPHARRMTGKAADLPELELFRIEVGSAHGVQPGNIVGAIANEAELDSQYIGHVEILDDHSFVELPVGMPKAIQRLLRKTWVCGQQLQISRVNAPDTEAASDKVRTPRSRDEGKPVHGAQPNTRPLAAPGGARKGPRKGPNPHVRKGSRPKH